MKDDMARQKYETSRDRANQDNVKKHIEKCLNVICVSTDELSAFDFLIIRKDHSKIEALAEYKKRSNKKDKYPTFLISEQKIIHGKKMAELSKIPFMLVVEWEDEIAAKKIGDISKYKIEMGGRSDRGDSKDQERMIHFPVSEFLIIK